MQGLRQTKGMKNGKIRFLYEIGDASCRACDIGDTIDYFLDEDISPTIDAVPVVRCKDCKHHGEKYTHANGYEYFVCWRDGYGIHKLANGFCDCGERKET